jgi:hypothetical protein
MLLKIHNHYDNMNIILKRNLNTDYNDKERYQKLEQSIELDNMIKSALDKNNIPYIEIDVDKDTVNSILNLLNQ